MMFETYLLNFKLRVGVPFFISSRNLFCRVSWSSRWTIPAEAGVNQAGATCWAA